MPATVSARPRFVTTTRTSPDATPQEIIAAARSAPAAAKPAVMLACATAIAMWASFTPVDFGPLGWICLVPLLALVRIERPTRRMYLATYAGGWLFWMASLQWMRLGHVSMYVAWFALATHLAMYWPAFVGLSRVAVHQLRMPFTLAVPVVWVGLEYLRGFLMTGFAWYNLSHSQYRWIELIQISDVVGAYGVSFVLALVNAAIAASLPEAWLQRFSLSPPGERAGVRGSQVADGPLTPNPSPPRGEGRTRRAIACLLVFAATLGYGYVRRHGIEFTAGPRVAAIQGNVTSEVKHDPEDWGDIYRRHEALTARAVLEQPDLIVWPETMFRWPLVNVPTDQSFDEIKAANPGVPLGDLRDLRVPKTLQQMAQKANASLVIGLEAWDADRSGLRPFNSAVLVEPERGIVQRYDKRHRVPFGEFIPLADVLPQLHKLTPFADGFGIAAGSDKTVFASRGWRFAPIICFEDTVPHFVRDLVASSPPLPPGEGSGVRAFRGTGVPPVVTGETPVPRPAKPLDFLLNLTNDGWFHGSSELDQHLITAAFRCVETRTPMVRAVNTGISAIIDGDGVIRRRAVDPRTGRSKQIEAIVVDTVPLDPRRSLYVAGGDWFAGLCLTACGLCTLLGLTRRWLPRRQVVRL
jgi:apolipoprotein N-acyltransferase